MADDACTRKVKRQYKVWPSARASQAVAKCRKKKGQVRKGEKASFIKGNKVDRVLSLRIEPYYGPMINQLSA